MNSPRLAMPAGECRTAEVGETFSDFFEWCRTQPVYVILGVQGSGTNLLVRLLRQVYGMSVLQDQSLVVSAAARVPVRPSCGEIERQFRYIESRMLPSRVARKLRRRMLHGGERFEAIADHFRQVDVRSAADLALFVYAYRAFVHRAHVMAIKSDDIWAHADVLDHVLPGRRIILLTRDFRDNAVSVMGKPFGPVVPVNAAHFVHERFACYEREYQRSPGPSCHVRYEDLLTAPVTTLERLGDAFGLTPVTAPGVALCDVRFRENRIGRWAGLPPRELAWCETILGKELVRYGYRQNLPPDVRPSVVARATMVARDVIGRLPNKFAHVRTRLRS